MLLDPADADNCFSINFWHWRAIVEAVRRLEILPEERVDALHSAWCGNGLTRDEALRVAEAIRTRLLSTLTNDERLLLDGATTREPDDRTFHQAPETLHLNYSTTGETLARFADYCSSCGGFEVN